MNITFIDVETTIHTKPTNGKFTPLPHYPENSLVCIGILTFSIKQLPKILLDIQQSNRAISSDTIFLKYINNNMLSYSYYYLYPLINSDQNLQEIHNKVQEILNKTEILVAHSLKFDLLWLLSQQYKYTKNLICTMNTQYVLNRGQKDYALSLEECCALHHIHFQKTGTIKTLFSKGMGANYIKNSVLERYQKGDVFAVCALWCRLLLKIRQKESIGLVPTINLTNEYIYPLIEMEKNGVKVDLELLKKIQCKADEEIDNLTLKLYKIVRDKNGDHPVNLNSNLQLSQFLYSRKVITPNEWKTVFNIGTDKYRPRMSAVIFVSHVKRMTALTYKESVQTCEKCQGSGKRTPPAKRNCVYCKGTGCIYIKSIEISGLKLTAPNGIKDVTAHGFKTNQSTLLQLQKTSKGVAKEFVTLMLKLSKLITTAQTLLPSIINNVVPETGLLHPKYNQTMTRTARLSSSDPNVQNWTRGHASRKAFVSRWKFGVFTCADEGQLEYRTAVFLAQDKAGMKDIKNNIDAHKVTADIVFPIKTYSDRKESRQQAKSHTFKPLYGGTSGTELEVEYYKFFLNKHQDIANWHRDLQNQAIRTKVLTLPSGRQYTFPEASRRWDGSSTFSTQIKNYPVQGFATADMVPVAIIELYRSLKKLDYIKSLMVLTTHDDVVIDTHPDEIKVIPEIIIESMGNLKQLLKTRYDIDFNVPLKLEIKQGPNLLDLEFVTEFET